MVGNRINSGIDSTVEFDAGRCHQGRGVLEYHGQGVRWFGKKAYIVSGPRTFDAVKDRLPPGLIETGMEFVVEIYDGACSYEAARAFGRKCLNTGYDEAAGIGGGVTTDLSEAVTGKAGVGVISIPTSIATCTALIAMSVMYAPQGAAKDDRRYEYETDRTYVDLGVISGRPYHYAAAGILDAMAKKIKILNGRPAIEPDIAAFDLYTVYRMSEFAYDLLERYGHQVIEDIRRGTVTKTVEYVTYVSIAVTGIISNITRSSNQSTLAHMIYYGIRICFTREARQTLHGEIVAVGLFVQLHYSGLGGEMGNLKEFMGHLDIPLSSRELGVEAAEANLLTLEQHLADSPYVGRMEKGLGMLHESIRKLPE